MKANRILLAFVAIVACDAFSPVHLRPRTAVVDTQLLRSSAAATATVGEQKQTKAQFLDALDKPYDMNKRSEDRTQLLNDVLDMEGGLANPGSEDSFSSVASGVWRVVYAPHMTIMAGLVQGEFSVQVSDIQVMY